MVVYIAHPKVGVTLRKFLINHVAAKNERKRALIFGRNPYLEDLKIKTPAFPLEFSATSVWPYGCLFAGTSSFKRGDKGLAPHTHILLIHGK